jgi:hypothetical protein
MFIANLKSTTMKTINLLSGMLLVTAVAAVSCMKNNDINPSTSSASFKIQATSKIQPVTRSLSATGTTDLVNNSFVWDTAIMVVSKIEMEAEREHEKESGTAGNVITAKDGGSGSDGDGHSGNGNSNSVDNNGMSNSDSANFEWRGPKTVDLFNLNSVIGGVTLVPGTFSNVTIKIKSFKSDAPTTPLFYLTGDYTNFSGTVKRINIVINEDFELRVNKTDTLDFAKDFTSVIKMNLSIVMSDINQTALDNAVLTNGKLVISSSVNVTLYNRIKKNLHESGDSEFERD